jgi:hypothetical protein
MKPEIIKIDDVEYVRRDLKKEEPLLDGMKCVIVRTYSAGVFYGYLKRRNGQEITLLQARRMWKWFGASLSEVAQSGTPNKNNCKFPEKVGEVVLLQAIEILTLTVEAKRTLDEVEVWKA